MNQQDRRTDVGGRSETTPVVGDRTKPGLDALLLADAVLAEAFSRKSNLLERAGELIRTMVYDQRRAATALAAERDRADRAEAALSRLSDAHDVHVEMDKTFEYECPQCRHEATA